MFEFHCLEADVDMVFELYEVHYVIWNALVQIVLMK